jgi:hypothetical protein
VVDLTWAICPYCGDDGSGNVLRPGYQRQRIPEQTLDLYDR